MSFTKKSILSMQKFSNPIYLCKHLFKINDKSFFRFDRFVKHLIFDLV